MFYENNFKVTLKDAETAAAALEIMKAHLTVDFEKVDNTIEACGICSSTLYVLNYYCHSLDDLLMVSLCSCQAALLLYHRELFLFIAKAFLNSRHCREFSLTKRHIGQLLSEMTDVCFFDPFCKALMIIVNCRY